MYRILVVSGEGGWGAPSGGGFLYAKIVAECSHYNAGFHGGDLPISLDVDPLCLSVRFWPKADI
jgi:hypothetical protein